MKSTDRLQLAKRINHIYDDCLIYSNDEYEVLLLYHVVLCVVGRNSYNIDNDPVGFESNPDQIKDLIASGKGFDEYIIDNGLNTNNTEFMLLNEAFVDYYANQWLKSRKKRLFSKRVELIDQSVIDRLIKEIEDIVRCQG